MFCSQQFWEENWQVDFGDAAIKSFDGKVWWDAGHAATG